jgi:hypothetical protein
MNIPKLICSVCQYENDQFATTCKKCGSFLQDRVANLDLFRTLGLIIENPKKAYKLITLSEHKNYSLFLFLLFGIRTSFFILWQYKLGEHYANIFVIILWALLIGIPLGIVLGLFITVFNMLFSKILGGKTSFRYSLGVSSYSLAPIIISLFALVPIQLMTFGIYYFTFNPHPLTIKPELYIILIGFDSLLLLWTLLLSIIGVSISSQISLWKSILVTIMTYSIVVGLIEISGKLFYLVN